MLPVLRNLLLSMSVAFDHVLQSVQACSSDMLLVLLLVLIGSAAPAIAEAF